MTDGLITLTSSGLAPLTAPQADELPGRVTVPQEEGDRCGQREPRRTPPRWSVTCYDSKTLVTTSRTIHASAKSSGTVRKNNKLRRWSLTAEPRPVTL